MAAKKMYGLNISLADELRAQLLKAVIDYEAARRGLTRGQALTELVTTAADLESYPQVVRDKLEAIAERTRERAAAEALAATRRTRVA